MRECMLECKWLVVTPQQVKFQTRIIITIVIIIIIISIIIIIVTVNIVINSITILILRTSKEAEDSGISHLFLSSFKFHISRQACSTQKAACHSTIKLIISKNLP